jgi:hypothetical protein
MSADSATGAPGRPLTFTYLGRPAFLYIDTSTR